MKTRNGVSLDQFLSDWRPGTYRVFVYVVPTKRNHLTEPILWNVGRGGFRTLEEARAAIAEDKKEMSETYGGLIDPTGTSGRHYRIFKAEGFTPIE